MGTQGHGGRGTQGSGDMGVQGHGDTGTWGHRNLGTRGHEPLWMGCSGAAGVGDLERCGGGVHRAGACTELAGGVFVRRGCARVCLRVQRVCTCVCVQGSYTNVCASVCTGCARVCACVRTGCACHACVRTDFCGAVQELRVHRVPRVVPMRVQGPCVPPPSGAVTPPFLPGTRCPHGTVVHPSAHAGWHRAAGASSDHVDPGGQRAQKGLAQGWMEMWGPPRTPSPVPATRGRAGSPWRARAPSRPRVHRHMSQ